MISFYGTMTSLIIACTVCFLVVFFAPEFFASFKGWFAVLTLSMIADGIRADFNAPRIIR